MSTSTSTSPSPTLSPSFKALLDSFRSNLPVRFQQESWYIIAAASLVALNKPSEIGLLFTYIRQEQKSESKEELRQVLVRLRDVLMKGWVLVGIPVVVTAVAALAGAEEGLGLWEGDGEGDGAEGEGEGKW
ncbi:MAG: hypothetical protein M1834_007787 [Cirrosporium novae-zelandiae]|nr:MAG: hypothetical protein M1834_007787 [Cirrosporium novae-zelandiae]